MTHPVREYLAARLPDFLALLGRMVAVNSFTDNADGVNAVGRLTAEAFAGLGFAAEAVPSVNPAFGDHLFLTRRGSSPSRIAFVSHLDTVFPSDEEDREHFRWREDDSRVWGPGVADIKGGTVVALMVIDALSRFAPDVFAATTWVVALDASEERLGTDFALALRERLPAARAVLVMECGAAVPGPYRLVVQRKGMATFVAEVAGTAAHSGTGFFRGDNAIVRASRLAQAFASLSDEDRHLTVNIGRIDGGTVTNRVPHACRVVGELRAFEPAVLDEAIARMKAIAEGVGRTTLTFSERTMPWPRNPGTQSLYEAWKRAGERLGIEAAPEVRGGLSDGNYLWDHAPTIDGLGPVGGNCHCSQAGPDGTGQEYALKTSFVEKAVWTFEAIRGL